MRTMEKFGIPSPSKRLLPDWFKNAESEFHSSDGTSGAGLKKCMPYTDAMLSGYMLTFPVDVQVGTGIDGSKTFTWDTNEFPHKFIGIRPNELGETMPRPTGFAQQHNVFSGWWGFKAPRGWSILLTHPFNRVELPFHTVSAIIDSDEFAGSGNIPFFIRQDFNGIIEKGTPIAQLIPIKRAAWKMIIDNGLYDEAHIKSKIVREEETPYKIIHWHRKKYD
jgi:hypothetical protein